MINKNAGESLQIVGKDTYFVIKKSAEYGELTEGAFDPTISPIVNLWGIGTDHARLPNENEIESKLSLVNYKDIDFDENSTSIKLKHQNQNIDVGGIAKGYAADEVSDIFRKNNIRSALINLGGNIFALGNKSDGTPWNIGIQDPFKQRGEYIGLISVTNKSVVTSGNYEKFFIYNGNKYHHIFDPKTGYPSENGVISATIISDHSIDGDALSTCVYVMGLDKGIKLIESLNGIDAIFINQSREVYATSGIKDKLKLTNPEFICI